jgi:sulfur carrier protein ThiS
MARLEMEIEDIQQHRPANAVEGEVVPLQQRLQKISHVLSRVPL